MVAHVPDPVLLAKFSPHPTNHEVFYVSNNERKSPLLLAVADGDLTLVKHSLTKDNLDAEIGHVFVALIQLNAKPDLAILEYILNIFPCTSWRLVAVRNLTYYEDGSGIYSMGYQDFPWDLYRSLMEANNTKILELYIHHGLDITTEDGWLLRLSADAPKCMALLLDRGLDPNHVDYDGRSILSEEAEGGNITAMALLLEYGAKTADSLFFASHHGRLEAMKLLIQHGAEPNEHHFFDRERSARGFESDPINYDDESDGPYDAGTALHGAATLTRQSYEEWDIRCSNAEAVELLLQHGASLFETNGRGEMPYHIAKPQEKYLGQEMVEMFRPRDFPDIQTRLRFERILRQEEEDENEDGEDGIEYGTNIDR